MNIIAQDEQKLKFSYFLVAPFKSLEYNVGGLECQQNFLCFLKISLKIKVRNQELKIWVFLLETIKSIAKEKVKKESNLES